MKKNQQQNQINFLSIKSDFRRKVFRNFVMALTVMIFILGIGTLGYNHFFKAKKVSQTDSNPTINSEIPAWWYQKYFASSICEKDNCKPEADPDEDKLNNLQEFYYHTDPLNDHTVQDSMDDGELVAAGFDPSRPGRLTFEQVMSEDNILGESLLLDQDVKKLVAEDLNIDNISLSLVKDDEIKITYNETEEAYRSYTDKMQTAINRYFPQNSLITVEHALKNGNGPELESVITKALKLSEELKEISVPFRLTVFHKYNIELYKLIAEVLSSHSSMNLTDPSSDLWFDKVQQLLVVSQRLNLEKQKLTLPPPTQ